MKEEIHTKNAFIRGIALSQKMRECVNFKSLFFRFLVNKVIYSSYLMGLPSVCNCLFSPVNLSCISLIIRPAKEPRKEGRVILPFNVISLIFFHSQVTPLKTLQNKGIPPLHFFWLYSP